MAQRPFDFLDPSKRAAAHLNTMIDDTSDIGDDLVVVDDALQKKQELRTTSTVEESTIVENERVSENAPGIAVDEARREAPVITQGSNRERSRLLLITRDASVLHEGSLTYRRFTDLRAMFLEVHVLLLDYKTAHDENPVTRLFENVWVYTTKSSSWWTLGYDAYRIIEEQLVFSGGFRVDIVVAEDPFLSGLVGLLLAKKHSRPFQIHIYEDFFDEISIQSQEHPALYEWITHYVIKRVKSVRTRTESQRTATIARNPKLSQTVELLPSYYNLEAWKDLEPTVNLHERYPQFKFIMLHISSMRAISHSSEVLLGVAPILRRYPTIGLVVLGNGPLRPRLEREVISLGLQNQIEFEPMPNEVISHMKSANLLLHISEDGTEDDIVLAAATVRLPMIVNTSGLAGKLFVDGESAFLCASTDSACITQSINRLLNENQTRSHFVLNAYDTVFARIEQNYDGYLIAYRESMERSINECS